MNYQNTYNSLAFQKAEKELQMYYAIVNGQLIEQRKEELIYPIKESDENVGGGRSNGFNSKTENTAIKLVSDDMLKEYRYIYDKVLNVLQFLDKEELMVVEAYYSLDGYIKHSKRTIRDVQNITNKDRKYCEGVRYKVLSLLKLPA